MRIHEICPSRPNGSQLQHLAVDHSLDLMNKLGKTATMSTLTIIVALLAIGCMANQSLADDEQCMVAAIGAVRAPIGSSLAKWTKAIETARPDLKSTGYFALYQDESASLDKILGDQMSKETSESLDEDCNTFMNGVLHQVRLVPCQEHQKTVKAAESSSLGDMAVIEVAIKTMDDFAGAIASEIGASIKTCLVFDKTQSDSDS